MASNTHMVASFRVHPCMCAFARTCARVPVLHLLLLRVEMVVDATYQPQIYNREG